LVLHLRIVNVPIFGAFFTRFIMKITLYFRSARFRLCLLAIFNCFATATYGSPETIAARDATIDGVKLHYLTAGRGPAVVLLHGFAETSRMWRPIMPILAKKFTVIAPDLPGIGDSAIPGDGIDMISSAERIHALVRSLGIKMILA
jgi:hypothetical protein